MLILLGTNLILTVSRGGYLAFAALLFVITIFFFRNIFTPKKILIGLLAIVLIIYIAIRFLGFEDTLNLEVFQEHVVNVFYGAAYSERVETLQTALNGFYLHPWIGIGVGAFGPFAATHPYVPPPEGWKIVNNEFVELLSEVGILGFLSILAALLIVFFRSLKAIQIAKDRYLRAVMIGLFAAFIGVLVQYQTFSILYIMHIWFLIGLMISVQNIILKKYD
jgi:O-antigen ligase